MIKKLNEEKKKSVKKIFMKRKTRKNKSSRKILKDPIRENISTRNVKKNHSRK